ncbi:MAG: ATP-binding cassette domain-containing protein, partial [Thermoplasmata archaeon]|nr:ATP-binding cassette domain-containing protein [Thermoplasmata archaeon]
MSSTIIEFIDASLDIPGSKYDPVFDLNLEIKGGEFLGLCGTGHSGARTLCLMINGLAPHATGGRLRGHVFVKGLDTRKNPPKMLALHVGIVFEDPEGQFLGMTVEDHVAFAPENLNLPIPEIRRRVDWALESVGMLSMRHRSITDLSGGQKQRLAIAAALSMHPDILVLSDVTFALDPIGANEVYVVARQLNKEHGVTIIILDQDTEKLCEYCDRLAVMDAGRLVAIGRPDEVFSEIPTNVQHAIRMPQVTELFNAFQEKFGVRFDKVPVNLDEAMTTWQNSGFVLRVPRERYIRVPISGDPIIQVKDLVHVYPGGNRALNHINLDIH